MIGKRTAKKGNKNNEEDIGEKDIDERVDEFISLILPSIKNPRENRYLPGKKRPIRILKRSTNGKNLREKLDFLRMLLKYLLLDLESTRREKEYYRKLSEDK